jgi:hypothetical protein
MGENSPNLVTLIGPESRKWVANIEISDKLKIPSQPWRRRGLRVARYYIFVHTKITNFVISWMALEWKTLLRLIAICYILRAVDMFCGHLVYFTFWYVVPK